MKPLRPKAPPQKINSDRIMLKKHNPKLAETMFAYVDKDRKRLRKFLPWVDSTKSVSDELKYIQLMNEQWKDFKHFDFGIFRKTDNVYMGNIGVHSIHWKAHVCELGYWILGDFEGQGYMSEAVRALETEMFKLGFNRVQIRCSSANMRSANVPKACGYKHEGTIRHDGIDLGKYRDTHVFGKLKSEWKKKRRPR